MRIFFSSIISHWLFSSSPQQIQHEGKETDTNELIIKILTIKNMKEAFMHLDKFFIMEECDIPIESVYG